MVTIAERLEVAHQRISDTATLSNRNGDDIRLLAVSKTKPVDSILAAYKAGHREFGESYVQEACEKIAALKEYRDIIWHFIGPIQSNKSRLIAEHFGWVQSIDREKIARRLNEQRPTNLMPLNVLIQVNISGEESKSGCPLHEIDALAAFIAGCRQLTLRGLMAIPEKTDDKSKQLEYFKQLKVCFDKLRARYPEVDTLSMGMSDDMESAIEAGSTMVRIGTAIFGARN